ncbi:MAG: sensor histidine kinase [Polyangiaceae bacterium]
MKIVPKLTLALVAGTCVILGVNGYLRVQRERGYFEADRSRDHAMIGRSLEAVAAAVWKSDGPQAAVQAIDAVSSHFTTVSIRWVGLPDESTLPIDRSLLDATPGGEPITRLADFRGEPTWATFVPLDVGGTRRGVIELSEPMVREQHFVRSAILDTAMATAALAIVSALLSFLMGQWLVGRRVKVLSEKARRIGLGDFSGPLVLRQRDELTDLAREVNAMCVRLVTTVEQLRHADRLATVGKLASGVAHELGTPLNVVGARAKMIADGDTTPEESKDYARVVVSATERMTRIIKQLLQFARRGGVEKSRRDVGELAKDTLDLLRPLADKKRVTLDLDAAEGDVSANVDAGQMQQVLTNLAMNAIQAMPEGGTVEVAIERRQARAPGSDATAEEGECLCIRVKDEGQGIPEENLRHLFEPFFTTKDVGEGTGLGLAVTYGIVHDHGGWITVESEVGHGSTFAVYLPAGTAQ